MNFWIVALGLAGLIAIFTLLPIFRNRQLESSAFDYDREIYKSRIKELDRELKLGTLSKEQHEYAISEEGRRLLAKAPDNEKGAGEGKLISRIVGITALIFIPAFSFFIYTQYGAGGAADQPLQARLNADPRGQSVVELVQRAEMQLARNPDDARGWKIIAPIYRRLNRLDDAETAYRNVIRIAGPDAEMQTSLGEVLSVKANGEVSAEAKSLFEKAAKLDPGNAKPQFFLAIALNQAEEYPAAEKAWLKLIAKSPENAPWLRVARQQLALALSKQGKPSDESALDVVTNNAANSSPKAPGNPTKDDIESASQLSAEDRQQFINDMVERLEGDLAENPNNKAGWQRIIRSYMVLKRKEDALVAIAKAQSVFADDAEFMDELKQTKAALSQ